ncbi:hypothetical protein HOLleu_17198 [Holothuria leucospilota]|uniref:Uncharacterized protein n=1 Tax=Holothuria leucospilota TaxID=206669 RepID=A0A9Q1C7I7_HOLLE|nr:hypothetical protein HOLleu_17198 [Holothuria leucospilota]
MRSHEQRSGGSANDVGLDVTILVSRVAELMLDIQESLLTFKKVLKGMNGVNSEEAWEEEIFNILEASFLHCLCLERLSVSELVWL